MAKDKLGLVHEGSAIRSRFSKSLLFHKYSCLSSAMTSAFSCCCISVNVFARSRKESAYINKKEDGHREVNLVMRAAKGTGPEVEEVGNFLSVFLNMNIGKCICQVPKGICVHQQFFLSIFRQYAVKSCLSVRKLLFHLLTQPHAGGGRILPFYTYGRP